MTKKVILILIIILLILIGITLTSHPSVSVYLDGENVSVSSGYNEMNEEICDYTLEVMEKSDSNITTLKEGINNICLRYGVENAEINIDSKIGADCIPIIFNVEGTSMEPTLHDKSKVLVNKTHNIHVGDIVVADSPQYGNIVKRVSQIEGDSVYLTSDNKNVTVEEVNGIIYESKGITTWIDSSDIIGVVVS